MENYVSQCTLDIISGPMFSGKTTELLKRALVEARCGMKVLFVNNKNDTRDSNMIGFSTHNPLYKNFSFINSGIDFITSKTLSELSFDLIDKYNIICIDEAQFFIDLEKFVLMYVEEYKKNVIVAGLNGTYNRKTFDTIKGCSNILSLVHMCDNYIQLHSYCFYCSDKKIKSKAIFTFNSKNKNLENEMDIGGDEKYVACCRNCFIEKSKL